MKSQQKHSESQKSTNYGVVNNIAQTMMAAEENAIRAVMDTLSELGLVRDDSPDYFKCNGVVVTKQTFNRLVRERLGR